MRNLKVFVYGTLREGRGNHPLLGPTAVKVCDGTIRAQLWLVHTLPMITHTIGDTGADPNVVGEVWELDGPNRLADVDALEGHPHWYRREEVEVLSYENKDEEPLKPGETAVYEVSTIAWAYFMRPEEFARYEARRVKNGDYCNPKF